MWPMRRSADALGLVPVEPLAREQGGLDRLADATSSAIEEADGLLAQCRQPAELRQQRRRPDLSWRGLARRMGPHMAFADALRALNAMKAEGVVEEYAIVGAMAIVFWAEPVPTFDLDVLVLLPDAPGALVSLSGIYRWAEARGYPSQEEHILLEGLPTQFVPSPNLLGQEAIAAARDVDYQGVVVRVVPPEYLIALYLQPQARTARRRERAAMLLELPSLNRPLLDEILGKHGLSF
jgi:hypothetical protein